MKSIKIKAREHGGGPTLRAFSGDGFRRTGGEIESPTLRDPQPIPTLMI